MNIMCCRKHNMEYFSQYQPQFLFVKHSKISDCKGVRNNIL